MLTKMLLRRTFASAARYKHVSAKVQVPVAKPPEDIVDTHTFGKVNNTQVFLTLDHCSSRTRNLL